MSGRVYIGTQSSPEERRAPATYTSDRCPPLASKVHGVNVLRDAWFDARPVLRGQDVQGSALECEGRRFVAVQSQETGRSSSTRRDETCATQWLGLMMGTTTPEIADPRCGRSRGRVEALREVETTSKRIGSSSTRREAGNAVFQRRASSLPSTEETPGVVITGHRRAVVAHGGRSISGQEAPGGHRGAARPAPLCLTTRTGRV